MSTKVKSKKEKSKISKLIEKSDSENEENEHELSFYMNDRVKLMKEVLKIIKPKKIKTMAPDCIKDLDIEEINSMLLEELLGISNKRLKYIFNGQNSNEDSSSTDPEEEKQPIDIISLDDVSDDDFVVEVTTGGDKSNNKKIKPKLKKVKKEKQDKKSNKRKDGPLEEENLMSVLELLELQARARAIRSQLTLEASKKNVQPMTEVKVDEDSDNDDIIIEVPKSEEIVINSSDSEVEEQKEQEPEKNNTTEESHLQRKKITLVRDRITTQTNITDVEILAEKTTDTESCTEQTKDDEISVPEKDLETVEKDDANKPNPKEQDEDEIILIVDQEEMKGIMED